MTCEMFALCANDATGVVAHPILEYVPSCQRCADRLDGILIPAEFTLDNS